MADDERQDPKWSEMIKRVFAAGVSGAMLSEEAIRTYLAEVKLPKDVLNLVIQGAAKSKEEVAGRVSKEIIKLLDKVDIVNEVSKFAEEHKFKITAEIEITRKDGKAPRSLSIKTAAKDSDREKSEDAGGTPE